MSIEDIRQKLKDEYSDEVVTTLGGPGNAEGAQLLDELRRREVEEQVNRTAKFTTQVARLTWVITFLTVVIAIAAVVGALR